MLISIKIFVFQCDISGNEIRFEHSENNPEIYLTLLVSHLDISGNDIND